MKFEDYIESELAHKEVLEEASQIENIQSAYTSLFSVFDSLSDAFAMMARKGSVDGGGEVPGYLRKAENALVAAKDRIKSSMKYKSEDKFDPMTKKTLGEIGNSLEKIAERCKNIVDSATEPDIVDIPMVDDTLEVEPQKQEAVIMDRRKRSKKIV